MLIQKLRLQNGWSQQQLAEMSGLSKRTIQRIENGKNPSIESVKSLAAVFEVDFITLKGALAMNQTEPEIKDINNQKNQPVLSVSEEEKKVFKKVEKIKKFYYSLFVFFWVIILLVIINWVLTPGYWWVLWVIFGWGLGFLIKASSIFIIGSLFDEKWEKKQIEKRLNRKL